MNIMKTKPASAGATLATLFVGGLIGYACSEAARSGGPPAEAAAAQAGEAKAPTARARTALPRPGQPKKVRRFGQVIGLKPNKRIIYNMLHAHPWAPVNKMIKECNIQNYSIYETKLGGRLYLFAYFEYTGEDFQADMAKMAKDKFTREWWSLTDPCQIRLPGTPEGEQWKKIPEVYHLD